MLLAEVHVAGYFVSSSHRDQIWLCLLTISFCYCSMLGCQQCTLLCCCAALCSCDP